MHEIRFLRAFKIKAVNDYTQLLLLQEQLQKETGQIFTDLSISETIFKLLLLDEHARAKKVVSDYKVSSKKFWWLQLRSFIARHDWSGLDKVRQDNTAVFFLF